MDKIYTAGIANYNVVTLSDVMAANKSTILVDVRDERGNRYHNGKFEFEENFVPTLNDKGITYVWIRDLGVPASIRSLVKHGKMTATEFEAWYMENKDISVLFGITEPITLLCQEATVYTTAKQPWICHRGIVAKMMVETGHATEAVHLEPTKGKRSSKQASF